MGGSNSGARPIPEKGNRYGHWTVIGDRTRGVETVLCRCDCGREYPVRVNNLHQGVSTRCKVCTYTPERLASQAAKARAWMTPERREVIRQRMIGRHFVNPTRKFTPEQINQIRSEYKPHVVSYDTLAERYNVAPSVIWKIIKGRTYKL